MTVLSCDFRLRNAPNINSARVVQHGDRNARPVGWGDCHADCSCGRTLQRGPCASMAIAEAVSGDSLASPRLQQDAILHHHRSSGPWHDVPEDCFFRLLLFPYLDRKHRKPTSRASAGLRGETFEETA